MPSLLHQVHPSSGGRQATTTLARTSSPLHTVTLPPCAPSNPGPLRPALPDQARDLRPRVAEFLARHDDVLFVVSALSRGIQTFMHMNPFPDRLTSAGGSRALNIIIQP